MEVSQIQDLDTHAVIGGGMAQAFSMSDSAEFFTVLSDTLYRDKMRAVVREVICNAWDAHIMGACTDRPVQITLSDTELAIRDFGPGIAADRIVPIYCVYGASTKVKDDNQTGGFGLGSKAPFAYSDHFTVTSNHAGTRSVYAISRGGPLTDGKPDIRCMVSVPTSESGITVSIPLKSREDRLAFENHIRAVVRQGGIKAELNGKPLMTFDYAEARQTGMGVVWNDSSLGESEVYVLYGTVLYPANSTDPELNKVLARLVREKEDNTVAILVAPPGSVGVTPSREALSFTHRTTMTVAGLAERMIKALKQHRYLGDRSLEEQMMKRVKLFDYAERNFPITPNDASPVGGVIADPKTISMRARRAEIVNSVGVIKQVITTRASMKAFPQHRSFYRRWLGELRKPRKVDRYVGEQEFAMSARLHCRLAGKLGMLKGLCVIDGDGLVRSITKVKTGVATKRLVVGPTKVALREWAAKNPSSDHWPARRLALASKRITDLQMIELKELAKRFKIELTVLPYVKPEKKPKAPPKPAVETKEAFYPVSSVHRTSRGRDHFYASIEQPTIVDPKFFISGGEGFNAESLKLPYRDAFYTIHDLFPGTAVSTSPAETKRLIELGAKDVLAAACDEFEASYKRRDSLYITAIDAGLMCADHGDVVQLADYFADQSIELAKTIYPVPGVKIDARTARFRKLLLMLQRIQGGDSYQRSHNLLRAARDAALEAIKPHRVRKVDLTYLKAIESLRRDYIVDWKPVEVMVAALKTFHRRHRATPTTTTVPMKEAA